MKKILSYILSIFYYLIYGILVLIFEPVQIICRNIWGYNSHKKSVDILNFLLFKSLKIIGTKNEIYGNKNFPKNRPLIIVSNHQSSIDISAIMWIFRKHHPKFISKIELAKNIPSISYNLRHSGAALIDRKNGAQSIKEIIKLGRFIEKNNYSACIFPEGTRSKDGMLKKFYSAGIKTLLKAAPSALIIPFAIKGNTNILKYGRFPLAFGQTIKYTILEPIEPGNDSAEEIVVKIREAIKNQVEKD